MKRIAAAIFLLISSFYGYSQVSIHYWNFNAGAATTTGMKWPSPIVATSTANYGSISHNFDNTDNFAGTTTDAAGFSSPTAGDAFCVVSDGNNNKSLIIHASTLGYKDIVLTYATRGTSSGYNTHTIDYSLDGTAFTNIATITGRTATSFSLQTVSFSSITAANNNPSFLIRITVSGATASSGNNRFDNIRISGVSSPCAPTNQPTALVLTPTFNSIAVSFTAAASGAIDASGYLVLMSTSSSLGSQPANGQVYNADDVLGNAIVVSAGGSTSATANSLVPGTTYYFFVYSYDAATNCYNLVSPLTGNVTTNVPPPCTAPTLQASGLNATGITSSSMDINYTRGNGDKILVIARQGSPVDQAPFNSVTYPAGSQVGTGNIVVYNGTASTFNYGSLLGNASYYFALYEYNDAGVCYYPSPLTGSFTTACTFPAAITSLGANAGNAQVSLSWSNPASTGCYDQVMVVASVADITGGGNTYTGSPNTVYAGGAQVVMRSMANAVTVTGLTNNTTYYFRVFTRLGANWSAGEQITVQPFDPSAGYQYLFGNLHAHSSYSDGNKDNTAKTPKDDFEFARDANCMDFLGISEHNHSGAGMNYPDYLAGFNQANLVNGVTSPSTGNSIVTLWGMEWGVINNGGHVLVYGFNDKLIGWEAGNYDNYVAKNDYSSLWSLINNTAGSLATLAHPNTSDYSGLVGTYTSAADNAITGSSIESGPAFSQSTTYNDFPSSLSDLGYFKSLLSKGYHVAPQMDHDNHYMTFGTVNTNRTVVLASSKTRAGIMEALRARRYYASQDCNARIEFKNNSNHMGSIVTKGGLPSFTFLLTDPDGEATSQVELWGGEIGASVPGSALKTYTNTSSFTFSSGDVANVQPNNSSWYYFTITTQADGNKIVSSPIWYTRSDLVLPVTLSGFEGSWTADGLNTLLNWVSTREINSRDFTVQRSLDNGTTWTDLAILPAGGNTGSTQRYQYTDHNPSVTNWYRLKMTDGDGQYQYSRVIMLTKDKTALFAVYPNPARHFIYLKTNSGITGRMSVRLVDNTGREQYREQLLLSSAAPAAIDINNLPAGIYYIIVSDGRQQFREKIVIASK